MNLKKVFSQENLLGIFLPLLFFITFIVWVFIGLKTNAQMASSTQKILAGYDPVADFDLFKSTYTIDNRFKEQQLISNYAKLYDSCRFK